MFVLKYKCKGNLTKKGVEFFLKNKIKEFRKKKNISQADLSKILKVSRQTIISIEKGKYNPSLILAYQLACFFDTKIENLFLFEEDYNEIT